MARGPTPQRPSAPGSVDALPLPMNISNSLLLDVGNLTNFSEIAVDPFDLVRNILMSL